MIPTCLLGPEWEKGLTTIIWIYYPVLCNIPGSDSPVRGIRYCNPGWSGACPCSAWQRSATRGQRCRTSRATSGGMLKNDEFRRGAGEWHSKWSPSPCIITVKIFIKLKHCSAYCKKLFILFALCTKIPSFDVKVSITKFTNHFK